MKNNNVSPILNMMFPSHFKTPIKKMVVFSGNLTDWYNEIISKLNTLNTKFQLKERLWEIQHLVGFDKYNNVIILISRITGDDDLGENEFLVSSESNNWIAHINTYTLEDVFFKDCISLIKCNPNHIKWETFNYDDNGDYLGQLIVEPFNEKIVENLIKLPRNFHD